MVDVLVAIPTFRRPMGLARLLTAIERLETNARVEVLVADNDVDGREGALVCEEVRANKYRWPLHCVAVRERGIAQARNALFEYTLANSTAPYVAMLDDDEWPDVGWLDAFLEVQRQFGADSVHGAVLRIFDVKPGTWASRCQGIAPLRGATGLVDMIHGSANVLLTRTCLLRLVPPWFDPEFGLTGGEDKEFFTRLKGLGARFAWADEAIAFAHVPASRSRLGWVLQRAYRVGNSDMRVFLKHERSKRMRALEAAKIVGAMLLSPLQMLAHAANPGARTACLCTIWRAAGKIAATCGVRYNEYATIHGR